jgi:signal transduction histidine kinase
MLLLGIYLLITGNPFSNVLLIVGAWLGIVTAFYVVEYQRRNRFFRQIFAMMEGLQERYLLAEMMPVSQQEEDKLYREILHQSNKAVIEKISSIERERKEYQEFIESWIHEVKAPMTDIRLICANLQQDIHQSMRQDRQQDKHQDMDQDMDHGMYQDIHKGMQHDTYHDVQGETLLRNKVVGELFRVLSKLSEVEDKVDMALYYARSEEVYRDYLIAPIPLQQEIGEVLKRDKQYFIEHSVSVTLNFPKESTPLMVPADKKWLDFILHQILLNGVKYRKGQAASITISAESYPQSIDLHIEDHGIGIPPHDIGRIFEKGFTGTNGRTNQTLETAKATGLGLYLCHKLCAKMGLSISAQSKLGEYTRITIHFPKSDYHLNLSNL